MITTGYWCDECRQKYVAHMCRRPQEDGRIIRRLPCGHEFSRAIQVWCQAFRRGGEHVSIGDEDVWLYEHRQRNTAYGHGAVELWGTIVEPGGTGPELQKIPGRDVLYVGEWLATKSDAFVRAFFDRWRSNKFTPDWLGFREHPDAKRACALIPTLHHSTTPGLRS